VAYFVYPASFEEAFYHLASFEGVHLLRAAFLLRAAYRPVAFHLLVEQPVALLVFDI
jgi:hypothetical protein